MLSITMRYGSQRWTDMPFWRAVALLEGHVKAERDAWRSHMDLNEEQWVASFWSEVFSGADPPSNSDWTPPLRTLKQAQGLAQESRLASVSPEQARRLLVTAVAEYNRVHAKWEKYRCDVVRGAERAITTMEVTIGVLSAAGAVMALSGAGAAGAAGRFAAAARGLTVGTAFAVVEQSAAAVGRFWHLDEEVDYVKLAANISLSAAIGFITGKAGEKLLGSLAARTSAALKLDPELAAILAKVKNDAEYKKFLADFFVNAGANMIVSAFETAANYANANKSSRAQFLKRFEEDLAKNLLSGAGKQLLTSFAGTYGDKKF